MKVIPQGKNTVINLEQDDFIDSGGEGDIFEKNNIIFKIYKDLKKVIPYEKIKELSVLDRKNIIRPLDYLLNLKNVPVGFTMSAVKNSIPLSLLFTNDFRKNNNVQEETIVKLVENIISGIYFIHDKNILQIDGNENNYLVDKNTFTNPYFIDVDSFQTKTYPATAIMSSIQDLNTKGFSKLTDWYSFAVVSFQLFVGIHPYKGGHAIKDFEERIKKRISVFNKDVRLPPPVRDFSCIPTEYLEWYKKIFEKGDRIPPPKVAGLLNVVSVKVKVIQSTNNFEISFMKDFPDKIINVKSLYGNLYVKTAKEIYVGNVGHTISDIDTDIILSEGSLDPILVKIKNNKLILYDLNSKELIDPSISCTEKMIVENTLYVRNEGTFTELGIHHFNKIIVSVKSSRDIMPKSSLVLDGLIYQNILGKAFLTIPVPSNSLELSSCFEVKISELDGFRIISGKHENRICMIVGEKSGKYYKFLIKFDDKYNYEIMSANEVDLGTNMNFTVLSSGVCIHIDEEEDINVFFNSSRKEVTKIKDPDINSSMNLGKNGTKVLFYKNKSLYSLTMKKKH